MKVGIILFFIILLVSSVSAYDSFYVEAQVEDTVTFSMDIIGEFSTLSLPPSVKDLEVKIDGMVIECSIKEFVGESILDCGEYLGQHSIEISFTSNYPLIKLKDSTIFQYKQDDVDNFILKLGVGDVVEDERMITPTPDALYSDGKRVIMSWESADVSVMFQDLEDRNIDYLYIGLIVILLGYILFFRTKDNKEFKTFLLDNEEIVVKALKNHKDNQMWQKRLQQETGLPKVKLSRLLKSLEKREVIVKESYGNSNIIRLK